MANVEVVTTEPQIEKVVLELSKEEAEVLNRLLYCHIGGISRESALLTNNIGDALLNIRGLRATPLSTASNAVDHVLKVVGG